MKTIETKPGVTLGFINIPEMQANTPECVEEFLDYFESHGIKVTLKEIMGLKEPKKVIGKLSEITEEQARELIDLGTITFEVAIPEHFDGKKHKRYIDLNEWHDLMKFEGSKVEVYKPELFKSAKSLGIEEKEFDQYLVIKL